MIGDDYRFESFDFPKSWRFPLDCTGEIFVGGLGAGASEVYYLLNLGRRRIERVEVSVRTYSDQLARYLSDRLRADLLPYGIASWKEMPPNFLQPHEALRLEDGTVAVAMHNCGYLRLIHFEDRVVSSFPDLSSFEPIMFSATNSLSPDDRKFYYAEWSLDDRVRRYSDPTYRFPVSVKSRDAGLRDEKVLCVVQADECIHEVRSAPDNRHLLLTEFCLTARTRPPAFSEDVFRDQQRWDDYREAGLYDSHLFLIDAGSGAHHDVIPRGKTPGHVEFSLKDTSKFYLSCHNLSKAHGKVILHGNGALLEYEIASPELMEIGRHERPDFWRVTSHVVLRNRGASYVAATVYPNRLALFADDSFELVREVELFPHPPIPQAGLHFADLGRAIPIWLTTSTDQRYLVLTSNAFVYLYDIEEGALWTLEGYSLGGPFMGTAHITNLERGVSRSNGHA